MAHQSSDATYCFVVATVAALALELVTVLIVAWALDFRKFATVEARLFARLALHLAKPVTVTDAPLTSFFDSAESSLLSADVNVALPALNSTVSVLGFAGNAIETDVAVVEIDE